VFLKACNEPASQLNPHRDKIFNFPENIFFQQILQYKISPRTFAFEESVAARKPLWNSIMGKYFGSIHTPPLVLTGT